MRGGTSLLINYLSIKILNHPIVVVDNVTQRAVQTARVLAPGGAAQLSSHAVLPCLIFISNVMSTSIIITGEARTAIKSPSPFCCA